MKILNLYANIGGNRKLWGDEHEITAVEINPKLAGVYKDLYQKDNVIVGDAHEYLRKNFREFDFIWASPPCPTHSVLQMGRYYDENLKYPDMTLYQEIIWLKTFYRGKWVIENVKPYYKPLIPPDFTVGRHCFWSSDFVLGIEDDDNVYSKIRDNVKEMEVYYGFDLSKYKGEINCRLALRDVVKPEVGLEIFKQVCGVK